MYYVGGNLDHSRGETGCGALQLSAGLKLSDIFVSCVKVLIYDALYGNDNEIYLFY